MILLACSLAMLITVYTCGTAATGDKVRAWVTVLLLLALGTAMMAAMPGARPRLMARVHLALVALSALAVAGFAVYWNLTPLGI